MVGNGHRSYHYCMVDGGAVTKATTVVLYIWRAITMVTMSYHSNHELP